ncbi:hypothetical protein ASD8599_00721 [Ascidiaceihabitans donghaensis]|uniref:DUF1127 domain-containing protein n=1 Tax=Ascidiaceihabitans donghaensis TaxID=1510460 RepID=A0A2R8BAA0_9RHOB|nr:hypothetical protein ASD8599_00721 [Ascidiaceihabitans donghaensis]
MPQFVQTAPSRGRSLFVTIKRLWTATKPAGPCALRHISDAQARDIGLTSAQIEALRFEYPSRKTRHPGL